MTETLWWITLGIGAVVAVAVIAMLHTLLEAVRRIDENVLGVWIMGKRVARNTATTWLLGQTPRIASEIREEALKHAAFLESVENS